MTTQKMLDWESHLVDQAKNGETVAFEMLADQYRDSLQGQAYRILRNSEDASDAVQETLIKAMRALPNFRPGKPVAPWLSRICRNCCMDILRSRKKDPEEIEKFEYQLTSNEDVSLDSERSFDAETLQLSIKRLPSHYREIVMMRHYDQMEVVEIARAINKPEGTVKSWLFRARMMLRKDLAPSFS